jgi:hypothetical protein
MQMNDVEKNCVEKNCVEKNCVEKNCVEKNCVEKNCVENKVNNKDEMLIEIVMRQTDYSKEVAAEKLIQHKYNILSIVREYMSPKQTETTQVKSTSQLIYGEIRNMMGNASANYRRKKEIEEYRQNQIQAHRVLTLQNQAHGVLKHPSQEQHLKVPEQKQ